MDIRARAFVAAAAALCLLRVGSAGINSWTAVGPTGGQVQKVAYNSANPSIVYMISVGGFLRSQDGGATWQTIRDDFVNFPRDLAVDPSDPTRVYVVVPDAPFLLVSTDSGATLSAVASFPSTLVSPMQVQVSHDGATVCVTGGLNIACSANRAQTWSLRTPIAPDPTGTGHVNKLLIDPTNSATLYASAGIASTGTSGFFVTHDGATTWQQLVSNTDANSEAWDLAYSPGSPAIIWAARYSGLWYTNNGGTFWASIGGVPGAPTAVAVSPLNPAVVYVGNTTGQLLSWDNSGSVLTDLSGNSLVGEISSVAPHPTQSATVLTAGLGGLWGTVDTGATWNEQVNGLFAANVAGLSADPQSDRIYIGVATGGLYCLANGAIAATPLNNTAVAHLAGQPNSLQVNTLLAQGGTPGPLWASIGGILEESLDGGNSWPLLPLTVQSFSLVSSRSPPQTVLVGSGTGVHRSADGGTTWAFANTGFPAGASVQLLAMSASDPTIAYAAPQTPGSGLPTSYGVYRSNDGGQSWSAANSGMTSSAVLHLAVSPTDANVVYASTDTTMQKSTDGGTSWAPLLPFATGTSANSGMLAIDPAHPQILYAGTYGRISRSVDAGTTWETVLNTQDVSQWFVSAMLVDPNRTSNLLVGTLQTGVQEITIAPDVALQVTAPSSPIAVGAASTYQYTVTNKGPFSATGVQVALQLPAGAQSINAAPSLGACTVANTTANCSLGTLGNGASATVSLTAVDPAAGSFQVTGTVQADQPDSDTTNNTATSNSTVAVLADVSVTATGSTAVQEGGAASYTVTVANAGPNTATSTQLTYQFGTGLTPGTVSASGGTCTAAAALITCSLGDLAAANSVTVTINATAATAGTATSTAAVTTSATDTVTGNNSASMQTTITAPSSSSGGSSSGSGSSSSGGSSSGSGSSSGGGSHGGGGAISIQWSLVLLLVLGFRLGRRECHRTW
jgi:photosystem II stability/assembly factor-like uncharacterized protein/uncharacterized membrane protein YgcG